jgi:hypothetical protein
MQNANSGGKYEKKEHARNGVTNGNVGVKRTETKC